MTLNEAKSKVYSTVSQSKKGEVELQARPFSFYGSDEARAEYTLRLHKFGIGDVFVWRIDFVGETEEEVFDKAARFIENNIQ